MDNQLKILYDEYLRRRINRNNINCIDFYNEIKSDQRFMNYKEFECFINADIERINNNFDNAIKKFQEAIKINNTFPLSWNGLGATYINLKEYNQGEEPLLKAIQLDEKLFLAWNNLGIIYTRIKKYDKAEEVFSKTINIIEELNLSYASVWGNLGNLYILLNSLDKTEESLDKAEKSLKKAIFIQADMYKSWNSLGVIYQVKKVYDKAEDAYKKAIEINNNYIKAIINLGRMYQELKEYEKAEIEFKKVIEINPNDTLAHRYLGILYRDASEYSKAELSFNQEIKLLNSENNKNSKDDQSIETKDNIYHDEDDNIKEAIKSELSLGQSIFEQGLTYYKQGNYKKALVFFNQANDFEKSNSKIIYWLGLTYYITGKYNEAKEYISQLINYEDSYWKIKAKELLVDIENIIKNRNSNRYRDQRYDKLLRITKRIYEESINNERTFKEFLKPIYKRNNKLEFEVLRRWNSYTPIITNNFHESKGGGYFINLMGKGIVIDPGFNFIENFKASNHYFDEIDVVLISHAHNDHTADLESIITLLYKYNNNIKRDKEIELVDNFLKSNKLNPEAKLDLDIEFNKSNYRKIIDIYMTKSTFKKYSGMFDLFNRIDYHLHIIEEGTKFNIDNGNLDDKLYKKVNVSIIKAKHFDIVSDNSSVGFLLEFDNHVIIYTGDTGINKDIVDEYTNIYNNIKKENTIILLAHIGGFKKSEDEYNLQTYFKFYDNHLGRLGIAKLIDTLHPDICLISEFGEEFKNNRIDISKKYEDVFKSTQFIPCDIGLKLDLSNEEVLANAIIDIKIRNARSVIKREFINIKNIEVVELDIDNSLHYYDGKSGKLTEKEVGMGLLDEYKKERNLL